LGIRGNYGDDINLEDNTSLIYPEVLLFSLCDLTEYYWDCIFLLSFLNSGEMLRLSPDSYLPFRVGVVNLLSILGNYGLVS